jgi:8-hydroxy-5-deazaflavin:NADPH oxidoreductase
MRIGVLGTGMVGQAIAGRCAELGHEVVMGTRDPSSGPEGDWRLATFADAAAHAELAVNAVSGAATHAALATVGDALDGTVLLDVSNPLDFSRGMPPALLTPAFDSLAEQVQRSLPRARVVKSLNTMTAPVMVRPELVPGDHVVLLSGDDDGAKADVRALLVSFGWPEARVVDLGGLATARTTEAFVPLWVALWQALGTDLFNVSLARGAGA